MQHEHSFLLGINYQPRQQTHPDDGPFGWRRIDVGAVRHEMQHIADLGCDTIRLTLTWEAFQPGMARIGSRAMRNLERVLDLAQQAGLRAIASLLHGTQGGALQLPVWATGLKLEPQQRLTSRFGPELLVGAEGLPEVLSEGHLRPILVRDLYRDPEQLAAQRYLLSEVMGYFAEHPAVRAWEIGHDLDRVRAPVSNQAARDWFRRLAEWSREQQVRCLLGTVSPRGLARRDSLRPAQLADVCDALVLAVDYSDPLPLNGFWNAEALALLHALVFSLSGRSALISGLGPATRAQGGDMWIEERQFGQQVYRHILDEDQQAALLEAALNRLYREGAAGVILAAYADVPELFWQAPPLDQARSERSRGIVRVDGSEKSAATVVRSFAGRLRRSALPKPDRPGSLPVDPEHYWRNPENELRRLFASR